MMASRSMSSPSDWRRCNRDSPNTASNVFLIDLSKPRCLFKVSSTNDSSPGITTSSRKVQKPSRKRCRSQSHSWYLNDPCKFASDSLSLSVIPTCGCSSSMFSPRSIGYRCSPGISSKSCKIEPMSSEFCSSSSLIMISINCFSDSSASSPLSAAL